MTGKILLCFVVAMAVLASAFKPLKSQYQRKAESQMHLKSSLDQQWGKAIAILTLTAGLYSSPVLAEELTTVAPPAKSVLKSVLNDYKEKSVPVPVAPPVVTPPPVKKAVPVVVKKITPPVAVKKVDVKVEVPAPAPPSPAPPAPIVYSIKPDTDLLKKLEATRSKGGENSKEAKKIAVNEVKKVDVKEVKKVEIKAEVKKPEAKTNTVAKIVEKVPEKSVSAVTQKSKPPPAVAIPVTVKPVVKAAIVKAPAIPEEKALVEAYNKKAGTKSKLDQLNVNVKSSKQKMIQARSDIKKQEGKMEVFDKKLSKGDLDKDLKRSLIEDRKEEEKIYNQARKVLKGAENDVEKDTTEIANLEKVLKADDKVVDVKKALLKKREEEIVKETKAAADKKLKAAADAKAAALAKDIKAGEAVVVKAQADLEASINAKKLTQVKVAESKKLVSAEKEVLKKAGDSIKSIMKVLEKGKAVEDAEAKKLVELSGKVTAAELAETKAGDAIKSMEGLVNEAKAKLSITMKGK